MVVLQNNFILLHVVESILSNQGHIKKYIGVADKALRDFVNKSPKIYDNYFVLYNVHSLTHTCDDVQLYGSLENFSCFPFESFFGDIKSHVRGRHLP